MKRCHNRLSNYLYIFIGALLFKLAVMFYYLRLNVINLIYLIEFKVKSMSLPGHPLDSYGTSID